MVSSRTTRQAIQDAVARNPKLSQRAILSDVRSQGFRIGNQSGRSIINQLKISIARAGIIEPGENIPSIRTNEGSFLFNERDLRIFSKRRANVDNALRESIKTNEVFIKKRGTGLTRISDFSHVVISYRAMGTITILIEGRIYESSSFNVSGQFTTEVSAFTEELVGERVRQQAQGILTERFSNVQGLGNNSVVAGLSARIEGLRFDFTSLEPRGSAGRRR